MFFFLCAKVNGLWWKLSFKLHTQNSVSQAVAVCSITVVREGCEAEEVLTTLLVSTNASFDIRIASDLQYSMCIVCIFFLKNYKIVTISSLWYSLPLHLLLNPRLFLGFQFWLPLFCHFLLTFSHFIRHFLNVTWLFEMHNTLVNGYWFKCAI